MDCSRNFGSSIENRYPIRAKITLKRQQLTAQNSQKRYLEIKRTPQKNLNDKSDLQSFFSSRKDFAQVLANKNKTFFQYNTPVKPTREVSRENVTIANQKSKNYLMNYFDSNIKIGKKNVKVKKRDFEFKENIDSPLNSSREDLNVKSLRSTSIRGRLDCRHKRQLANTSISRNESLQKTVKSVTGKYKPSNFPIKQVKEERNPLRLLKQEIVRCQQRVRSSQSKVKQ